MRLPLPPEILLTNDYVRAISAIEEFKGEWRTKESLGIDALTSLRRVATIESVGSSTRIEGAKLSDQEVEALLGNLELESFQSRDEQEVAGYAYVMEMVQSAWKDLDFSEGILFQLHRDLLRYSSKDERHRGHWKTLPNHVSAFDAEGKEVGVIFETASPFETPQLMQQLLDWYRQEETSAILNPLLRIGVFNVVFLAIHPFQDGNGRLSRVLTYLQLLREGYTYAAYSSLENVIEHSKEAYYLALRRTQASFAERSANWEPWLNFFLRALTAQVNSLRDRLAIYTNDHLDQDAVPKELSPLAFEVLTELRKQGHLSVSQAAAALDANRNTIKGKFAELVERGLASRRGKGRGAHYRPERD